MRQRGKSRIACLLLCLCLLCGTLSASAAANTAVYTLSQQGSTLSMRQEEGALTFWEAPDAVTGQTYRDGTITLRNETQYTVDFVLSSVTLPYDNAAALTYLDALTVDIRESDRLLYHDTMTRLMDSERAEIRVSNVAPGEQRVLHVAVSCAYTYTGEVPSYSSLVWSFSPQVKNSAAPTTAADPWDNLSPGIDWLLIVEAAGLLVGITGLAGLCRWLVRRHRRQTQHKK